MELKKFVFNAKFVPGGKFLITPDGRNKKEMFMENKLFNNADSDRVRTLLEVVI